MLLQYFNLSFFSIISLLKIAAILGSPNRLSTTKKDVKHETVKKHIGLSFRLGDLCGTDAHIDVASIRKTNVLVRSGS